MRLLAIIIFLCCMVVTKPVSGQRDTVVVIGDSLCYLHIPTERMRGHQEIRPWIDDCPSQYDQPSLQIKLIDIAGAVVHQSSELGEDWSTFTNNCASNIYSFYWIIIIGESRDSIYVPLLIKDGN